MTMHYIRRQLKRKLYLNHELSRQLGDGNLGHPNKSKKILSAEWPNKNDVMRLGERPRSLEGKPDHLDLPFAINLYYSMSTISYGKALTIRLSKRLGAAMTARSFRFNIRVSVLS